MQKHEKSIEADAPADYRKTFFPNELENLMSGLIELGLRPYDWILINKPNNQFTIQNIDEPSFFFVGDTIFKNGRKKWNSIQLYSL